MSLLEKTVNYDHGLHDQKIAEIIPHVIVPWAQNANQQSNYEKFAAF